LLWSPSQPGWWSYFMLPAVARMTGMHHGNTFVSHWDGVSRIFFFCLWWPEAASLQILASHVAWNNRHVPPCPAIV
jgi:hypothetical protein